MAALYTAQHAALQASLGIPIDWGKLVLPQLIHGGLWALLAPVIAISVDRFRLDVDHRARRILILLAIGLALSVIQALAATSITMYRGLAAPAPHSVAARVVDGHVIVLGDNPSTRSQSSAFHFASRNRLVSIIGPNFILFVLIAGVLHSVLYYHDLRRRKVRESELEARLTSAELGALRAQIQPHFLFNTLHTVSSLMTHDVPGARRVLASLGDLLRLSIDQMHRQEVPLSEELEFVARYVDIQKARFRDRLDVIVEVPDELRRAVVPNLVLQPLVENAIRHGIEPHARRGRIWITAAKNGDTLLLKVRDDGPATEATHHGNRSATPRVGVGLANIRSRLEQLYGSSQTFAAGPADDGGFEVLMSVPYRTDGSIQVSKAVVA
jgi:two-component sensor histidine kinase